MKIIHILPEMEEGGVERHVLWLSNDLAATGHAVTVVSAGGKLESSLKDVGTIQLPVHKKNPFTALYSAGKIAALAKKEKTDIIHAHSRVPAWIAWRVSKLTGTPYVVTAHVDFGNKTPWIYKPYRNAQKVICVSEAVETAMKSCFSGNTQVVLNGMPRVEFTWKGPADDGTRFLFIGRLSPVKGIQDVVEILPRLTGEWTLDVVGDGPLFEPLTKRVQELGLHSRVRLHGFRDDTDQWLVDCSCLLFPSYTEGMPLTLARAVQLGVPVIPSSIQPVKEMAESDRGLIPPGEKAPWLEAIQSALEGRFVYPSFSKERIPTVEKMTRKVEGIYCEVINRR